MYNLPLAPHSPVYRPESTSRQLGEGSWAAVWGARALEVKRNNLCNNNAGCAGSQVHDGAQRMKSLKAEHICCYLDLKRKMKMEVAYLCPTLCNPMDYSPLGPSVHGISQVRILQCVAIHFSRGSTWPRDQTQDSCIVGRFFTVWATREALHLFRNLKDMYCDSPAGVCDKFLLVYFLGVEKLEDM